jgi:hypothetical protein
MAQYATWEMRNAVRQPKIVTDKDTNFRDGLDRFLILMICQEKSSRFSKIYLALKFPKWESLKNKSVKSGKFFDPKNGRQHTSFHQQSTTNSPSKNHILRTVFAKTPSKNAGYPARKKLLQKRSLFELGPGEGEAGAEDLDEVGDVVVEQDAGQNVFRGVDGHGGVEKARIAFEGVVDGDVFEARVKHCGVEQHETEVAAGLGGDLVGVDGGAAGGEVDSCYHVIDAEAEEGFAHEFGTEFSEVEGAEDRGFCLFVARR